jgi:Protein of unknown function (DUF1592)/Protein of unknown function (DUF1588)/Protein of unknown function (DUF1595)/Protein of unknown function (DUF1585)/Protein of unknown function (DUF1587)
MSKKQIHRIGIHAFVAFLFLGFQNCSPGFKVAELSSETSQGIMSSGALNDKRAFGTTGLRRLTRYELLNSVSDVFGVSGDALIDRLPFDDKQTIPFSNEYGTQAIAPVTIENYQSFAEAYSTTVVSRPDFATRLSARAGCTPKSVADRACFEKYLEAVGSRILRRPFTLGEIALYADEFMQVAVAEKNFNTAVELAIQAWLQNPEFLYRIEAGASVEPGLIALNDYEIASALSFLIWGRTPDDALLAKAKAGQLKLASGRVAETKRMLQDPKARLQWERFHAQWLGYETAVLPTNLASDMHKESDKLVDRIVFDEDSDWLNLLRSDETYLTPQLAQSYGIAGVAKEGWVKYSGGRGGGVLAHATFLSQGSKFGDTSPTLRGYETFKRLLCGNLGPVPDDVDVSSPPGNSSDCKPKRYFMRSVTACAGCHSVTDNIGFGLENFGPAGQWRTTEPNNPNCSVDNAGTVEGVSYSGPAALGRLLANNPKVSQCAVTQLFRFYTGRKDTQSDVAALNALNVEYRYLGKGSLQSLILALVESPAFVHKVQ